jgi:hypothetical protein
VAVILDDPYKPITTPPGGLLASAVGTPTSPNPPINPKEYEDDSVVGQMNAITNADSGYMQLARTSGLQTAAKRGLLNSSMAAGASQAAAIAAAAPLAQQEAAQRANRNQVRVDATFQNERQQAALQHDVEMQGRDITSREGMQTRDIAATRSNIEYQVAAESERLGRQLTAQEEQQVRDIASRTGLLNTELASREKMQTDELAAQLARLQISDAGETARANLSAATQTQLAAINNLNENQRATLNYILQSNQIYAQSLGNLYANKDLPAPLRDQAMQNFLALRNANVDLPATLFGTTTNWGTGTGAPVTTAPVASIPTPVSTPTASRTESEVYQDYLNSNPDVAAEYSRVASRFSSPVDYARWHYQQYGANEGRQLSGYAL